jgi:parvulin-like peptidyl-prolyl isomerase
MKITVNSETLPEEAILREIQGWRQQNLGADEAEAFAEVSRHMIEWTLIRQEAGRHTHVTPGEIEEGFDELCRSHGGQEAFFQRFGLTGENIDDVKKDVERNRQITKFLDGLSADVEPPPEDALNAFYEKNSGRFVTPEKVHAAHIVKHPQNEAAERAAATELTALRRRLLAGEDFLTVAEEASDCNDTSPDLGEFARGQMVPEFELVVFSMNPGEISPVFKTPFGLHVATVLGRIEAAPMAFEDCREQIGEILLRDLKNDAIGEWVDEQKKTAAIEVQYP